jgi:glutamate N-acetyltransferase/amino-acid N-acetyltransferase
MPVGQIECSPEPVAGIRLAAAAAGIRYSGRDDVALIECSPTTKAASIFTKNQFKAAPVLLAQSNLDRASPRFLLINSGNANAATGDMGFADAVASTEIVAAHTQVRPEEVLPFSTGVIGERLPLDPFKQVMPELVSGLAPDHWLAAAQAIMTTDTVPKLMSRKLELGGEIVTITGMAKGAGMIQPNMATMLCFIATDAQLSRDQMRDLLQEAADSSLNRVTVDSDTSTNDACVLLATGESKVSIHQGSAEESEFQDVLTDLMINLAQALVRDGEGATKFVTVSVEGAESQVAALEVAYSVANSPLVKTAIFAEDANWGRLVMAIGKVESELNPNVVDLFINDVCLLEAGLKHPNYEEALGEAAMKSEDIEIRVVLNQGECSETVWTSDLSHDYVKINAEYRT